MTTKKNGTVLIIDDEQDILEVLEILLTPTLKVLKASNGVEGLEIIQKNKNIDAILSDINMPKMDGLELLKKVREKNLDLPFVFLTAYGDKDKAIAALHLGATDFISKPFETEKLLDIISKSVQLGQILKSIEEEMRELCKESKRLAKKCEELQRLKLSMIGSLYHYRKIELMSDKTDNLK